MWPTGFIKNYRSYDMNPNINLWIYERILFILSYGAINHYVVCVNVNIYKPLEKHDIKILNSFNVEVRIPQYTILCKYMCIFKRHKIDFYHALLSYTSVNKPK